MKYVYHTEVVKDFTQIDEIYENIASVFENPEMEGLFIELYKDDIIVKSEPRINNAGENEIKLHVISPNKDE